MRPKESYRAARREAAKQYAREHNSHVSHVQGWRLTGDRKTSKKKKGIIR